MKNIINDIKIIAIMLLFSIGYSCILNNHFNIGDTINLLLIISFLIYTGGLITIIKINQKQIYNVYPRMAIFLAGAAVILLAYTYLLRLNDDITYFFNKVIQLNTFYGLYEVAFIIWAIKFRSKEINIKKGLAIVFLISMGISYISLNWNFGFCIVKGHNLRCVILKLLSILLNAYTITLLRKIKDEVFCSFCTYITTFLICKIVIQCMNFLKLEYINTSIVMISCTLSTICTYCIFKTMIVDVLENQGIIINNKFISKSKSNRDNIELNTISEHKTTNNEQNISEHEEDLKNQLLNNISHEFKTPVNVIYSAIQTQELLSKSKKHIEYTKYNSIIKQNCNRLIRLINNFIDANSLDRGNLHANFKCVNIVTLTKRIINSVSSYVIYKDLNMTFDYCEEELYVLVDVKLFDRLILNLLSNAIKFSENNGNINVYICSDSKYVEIFIKDNGIGIEKADLDLIFKKFERLDKSFSRVAEGSGLGLHIVKGIINLFNGSIKISSEIGKGTEVIVKIPKYNHKNGEEIYDENNETSINHTHEVEVEMSDIYL